MGSPPRTSNTLTCFEKESLCFLFHVCAHPPVQDSKSTHCPTVPHSCLHRLMHVHIWLCSVWLTWLQGLLRKDLHMVGKKNQPRWWFTGCGLFSLGKNKTLKPKNPVLKGGFHTECRVLPGSGRHPAGRGRDPAPSNDTSKLKQQHFISPGKK